MAGPLNIDLGLLEAERRGQVERPAHRKATEAQRNDAAANRWLTKDVNGHPVFNPEAPDYTIAKPSFAEHLRAKGRSEGQISEALLDLAKHRDEAVKPSPDLTYFSEWEQASGLHYAEDRKAEDRKAYETIKSAFDELMNSDQPQEPSPAERVVDLATIITKKAVVDGLCSEPDKIFWEWWPHNEVWMRRLIRHGSLKDRGEEPGDLILADDGWIWQWIGRNMCAWRTVRKATSEDLRWADPEPDVANTPRTRAHIRQSMMRDDAVAPSVDLEELTRDLGFATVDLAEFEARERAKMQAPKDPFLAHHVLDCVCLSCEARRA